MEKVHELVTSLLEATDGSYIVSTESGSEHLIDIGERKYTRLLQEGDISSDSRMYAESADYDRTRLRADGKSLDLVNVGSCDVGLPARFLVLGVNSDPRIVTIRQTTPVVSITRVDI